MTGELYFVAAGVLGIVLAGIGGLLAVLSALRAEPAPGAPWRITEIVRSSLQLTFLGFGVVATFAVLDDIDRTVRLMSLAAVLMLAYTLAVGGAPGSAWPDDRFRRQMAAVTVIVIIFASVNIGLASVGYLHLIMLVLLFRPASVLLRSLADLEAGETASEDT